jgi:hypothetical protein
MEERELRFDKQLGDYYKFLASSVPGLRGKEFWQYHRERLKELGYPLRPSRLLKAGVTKLLSEIANPQQAIRKFWNRLPHKYGIQ